MFCRVPALEGGTRDVSQQTPRQRFGIRRVPPLRVRDLSLSRVTYGGTLGSKASCLLLNIMPDIVYSLQRHVVAGCVCVGRIEEISKAALLPKSMATGPTKMQATALTVGGFKPRRERAKRSGAPRHIFLQSCPPSLPLRRESRTRRQKDREQLAHAAGSRFALSKVDNPNPLVN